MIRHKSRNYDLELLELLKQFEPHNLLITDYKALSQFESGQPNITVRWIDNTTRNEESQNANS